MKSTLETKLIQLKNRLEEITQRLASETITEDMETYRRLTREYADLSPIIKTFNDWQKVKEDLSTATDMLRDADLRDFAETEIKEAKQRHEELTLALNRLLLPKDPHDESNAFLEIRAGTGGNEAALFAAVLLRMYTCFAERNGWAIDIISAHESDLSGYKEVVAHITGDHVYGKMRFESGIHRVQRIPTTESQGRIHTSACTVAVLAEIDESTKAPINASDLRIDTFRASGAGGQHINKTDSAVRITHLPTGLVVECQDDRSQHRNKASALAILAARLDDMQQRERQQKEAHLRKSLIGSGDRSGRIRTYNYPQSRITDHRINLTLYKLDQILSGDLFELIDALQREHQTEKLALLSE